MAAKPPRSPREEESVLSGPWESQSTPRHARFPPPLFLCSHSPVCRRAKCLTYIKTTAVINSANCSDLQNSVSPKNLSLSHMLSNSFSDFFISKTFPGCYINTFKSSLKYLNIFHPYLHPLPPVPG